MILPGFKIIWGLAVAGIGASMIIASAVAMTVVQLQSWLAPETAPAIDLVFFGSPMFFGGAVLLVKERKLAWPWFKEAVSKLKKKVDSA